MKLLSLLVVFIGFMVSEASPATCYTLPYGLVSWWSGENNALDNVGCNHGTLVNGAHYAKGLFGQCFEFDGVNDYVEIPHDPNLSFQYGEEATIEFWVNSAENRSPVHFLGKRWDCSGPGGFNYQIIADDNIRFYAVNQWVHWAQVYQVVPERAILIYLNGILAYYLHDTNFGPENYSPLRLGTSDNCPASQMFKGKLDEIRIYNRALSSADIASIAANTTLPGCGNLKLTISSSADGTISVCWPTRPCNHYQLDYTISLNFPIQWTPLVKNLWNPREYYCYTDHVSNGQRFYRVVELP